MKNFSHCLTSTGIRVILPFQSMSSHPSNHLPGTMMMMMKQKMQNQKLELVSKLVAATNSHSRSLNLKERGYTYTGNTKRIIANHYPLPCVRTYLCYVLPICNRSNISSYFWLITLKEMLVVMVWLLSYYNIPPHRDVYWQIRTIFFSLSPLHLTKTFMQISRLSAVLADVVACFGLQLNCRKCKDIVILLEYIFLIII